MRKTQRRIRRRRGTKKYVRGGAPPLVGLTQTPQHKQEQESRGNVLDAHYKDQPKKPSTERTKPQQKYYREIIIIKEVALNKIKGINRRINDYIIHSITTEESIIFENVKIIKELKNRLYNTTEQIKQLNDGMTKEQINDVLKELEKINIDVKELIEGVSLSAPLGRTPIFRDTSKSKSKYIPTLSIMRNPPLSPFPQKTWSPPKHDFLSYTQPSP